MIVPALAKPSPHPCRAIPGKAFQGTGARGSTILHPARNILPRRLLRAALPAGLALCAGLAFSALVLAQAKLPQRGLPAAKRLSTGPIGKADVRRFLERNGPTPVNAIEGDRYVAVLKNDVKITYTFDRKLQRTMGRYLEKHRSVQHAAFVAIEPSTGRVLALVSYSRPRSERDRPVALRASFPAASIFKIVTVAAALQEKKVSPGTVVRFRGGYWTMNRSVLTDNPRRDRNYLTVERALAKSCNHCFGKIATRFVGTEKLKTYADAFAFNYPFKFELPVEMSRAQIPSDRYQLARTGAGFGKIFFSPLHAALIAATIANEGRMMEPSIIEKIEDRKGRVLYAPRPRAIARPLEASVARQINRMMVKTVLEGTSRRAFKGFTASHPHLSVAGKTGSLKGTDPPGHNYWFIGSAPADNPTIAVSALVIPRSGRRFKGNQVARRAFEAYFD